MMLRLKQLVFLIVCFPAFALAETGPDVPEYPADRVADNIYVIHGPLEFPNQSDLPANRGS